MSIVISHYRTSWTYDTRLRKQVDVYLIVYYLYFVLHCLNFIWRYRSGNDFFISLCTSGNYLNNVELSSISLCCILKTCKLWIFFRLLSYICTIVCIYWLKRVFFSYHKCLVFYRIIMVCQNLSVLKINLVISLDLEIGLVLVVIAEASTFCAGSWLGICYRSWLEIKWSKFTYLQWKYKATLQYCPSTS